MHNKDHTPDILFPGLVSERQFAAFNSDSRMQTVMIIGDEAKVQFYEFIKWCIIQDPDLGVRLAALKRLPNYFDQKDLPQFLLQLDNLPYKLTLEPYISMALSKLKLITQEELAKRLNGC